ncbi:MAG: ABC transporter substrate-binding protein, partial [Limnohabitans sp.]
VIDAAEFVGPADDEHLSLNKVAKYYYYPGWWEGSATLSLFINQKAFGALPAEYKAVLKIAAAEANQWSTAKYDASNPAALRRLIGNGAQLKRFSPDILKACYKANQQFMTELIDTSPAFKKIHGPWSKFRDEFVLWSQFCEMPFDNLMASGRKA